MLAKTVRDLDVYRMAFDLQQRVFHLSKSFPKEEMYSLTDQIRRSSRSIGANLSESWAKRRYKPHFTSKLTDADAETEETIHWIETAFACEYLDDKVRGELINKYAHIGNMLNKMKIKADEWCKPFVKEEGTEYNAANCYQ